jgi:predicted ATPase
VEVLANLGEHRQAARRQDFAEAVRTHAQMAQVYAEFGYDLVELPRASVAARLRFVLAALGG